MSRATNEEFDYAEKKAQILSRIIVSVAQRPLEKFCKLCKVEYKFPSLLTMIIVEVFAASLLFALWSILNLPITYEKYLWVLWGNLLTVLCIELVIWNLEGFLNTVSTYSGHFFSGKRNVLGTWINKNFNVRRQFLASTLFVAIIYPPTYLFFDEKLGIVANRVGGIILFTNMWIIGNGFYWIATLPKSAKAIRKSVSLTGYFDPKNTIWIDGFLSIYKRAATSVSLLGISVLISLSGSQIAFARFISVGWLIIILTLIIVPFLYAQNQFSLLIKSTQLSIMTDIQIKVREIIQKDEMGQKDRIETLLKVYDKTQASGSSIFNLSASAQFINSILLPVVSFITLNYTNIVSAIQEIVKSIFN